MNELYKQPDVSGAAAESHALAAAIAHLSTTKPKGIPSQPMPATITTHNYEMTLRPLLKAIHSPQFFRFRRASCSGSVAGLLAFGTVVAGQTTNLPLVSAPTNAPPEISSPSIIATNQAPAEQTTTGGTTNSPVKLGTVVVTGHLDAAREQIAPSLGAVTYNIGIAQIQSMGQGENATFQQVLLQAPGVVQEEFGGIHVRGDHGDVQYRINGVLLPESLNGFGQEIDTRLIQSVTLITEPCRRSLATARPGSLTSQPRQVLNSTAVSFRCMAAVTIPSIRPGQLAAPRATWIISSPPPICTMMSALITPRPAVIRCMTRPIRKNSLAISPIPSATLSRLTLLLSGSYADFQLRDTAGREPIYQLTNGPPPDSSTINDNQNEQNYYAVLSYQVSAGNLAAQVSALTRYTQIQFSPTWRKILCSVATAR